MKINRTKPFDPVKFIGSSWSIESQDQQALKLKDIDFSKVSFEHGLKNDEKYITGEQKLERLTNKGILLDAAIAQQLYEEKDQKTLRALYNKTKITWMEFSGTVLRYSNGSRYFLYLFRDDDGSWHWGYYWLGGDRDRGFVSPLLASKTSDTKSLHSDTMPLALAKISQAEKLLAEAKKLLQ